jgi:cytochrome c oxidase subunit II
MKRTLIVAIVMIATALLLHAEATPRVVEISAKRFEFAPNTITLKKGEPVTIRMTASDHSHGLFVKPLGLDLDAAPGKPDEATITPTQAGQFLAICDDYCGSGHGNMKMTIVVTE